MLDLAILRPNYLKEKDFFFFFLAFSCMGLGLHDNNLTGLRVESYKPVTETWADF